GGATTLRPVSRLDSGPIATHNEGVIVMVIARTPTNVLETAPLVQTLGDGVTRAHFKKDRFRSL
ncbi:MAG TPA: hypothetical protein PLH36_17890, partial [Armatimonadota bacterium]|nr:hypothetical protein [Armatimonadota bacterium]